MNELADVEFVLDSSALLAVLGDEPGADLVQLVLDRSAISTVNWVEVCQRMLVRTGDIVGLRDEITALGVRLLPLTAQDAERTAMLLPSTSRAGLSLGDRACLALAARLGLPALTSDRQWSTLDLGVDVRQIR